MKTTLNFTKVLILALLVTMGCNKEDDPLSINLEDLTLSIDENPTLGQVLGTVESSGPNDLTFSISSQNPGGAIAINASTGVLTVADPDLFDYETNPIITAVISADDADNTATVTINISNVNEVSTEDFSTTVDENPTNGQSLGSVTASGEGTLSYSIIAQTPSGALVIGTSTGELTVADGSLFDFETNPVIAATISVDNSDNVQTLTATINLNNVNELIVQDYATSVDENIPDNQSLGFLPVTGDGDLSFSIISQTPANAMDIDQFDGELTVRDPSKFDYETNPVITASISVDNSGNTETLTATINLNNVNEIGDYAYGGVIFWVNPTNDAGLVCTISDVVTGVDINGVNTARWFNGSNIETGATATAIGTGQANTNAIINSQGEGAYAASLCDGLVLNNYSDWYLPSIDELGEMYSNRSIINATAVANGGSNFSVVTWSSTQQNGNVNNAYYYLFVDGQSPSLNAKGNYGNVRAVRSWSDN